MFYPTTTPEAPLQGWFQFFALWSCTSSVRLPWSMAIFNKEYRTNVPKIVVIDGFIGVMCANICPRQKIGADDA
jgi:hypothetical protein